MKEVRDNTSRRGGLPTLPSLYLSTFQPSQRGFFRVHVCKERESWRKRIQSTRVSVQQGPTILSCKKKIKKSDPVMGAKLNFKTYIQNRFLNFLSHLSEGPKSYDCTKNLVLYILSSLYGQMCLLRHTFTNSWGSKLRPNYNKMITTIETHQQRKITQVCTITSLIFPSFCNYVNLFFTLINPIWEGVSVAVQ